jgi:hypothetical protein
MYEGQQMEDTVREHGRQNNMKKTSREPHTNLEREHPEHKGMEQEPNPSQNPDSSAQL